MYETSHFCFLFIIINLYVFYFISFYLYSPKLSFILCYVYFYFEPVIEESVFEINRNLFLKSSTSLSDIFTIESIEYWNSYFVKSNNKRFTIHHGHLRISLRHEDKRKTSYFDITEVLEDHLMYDLQRRSNRNSWFHPSSRKRIHHEQLPIQKAIRFLKLLYVSFWVSLQCSYI